MASSLVKDQGDLTQVEMDFFLKGNTSLEKVSQKKPYDWIADATWQDIIKLSEIKPGKLKIS